MMKMMHKITRRASLAPFWIANSEEPEYVTVAMLNVKMEPTMQWWYHFKSLRKTRTKRLIKYIINVWLCPNTVWTPFGMYVPATKMQT